MTPLTRYPIARIDAKFSIFFFNFAPLKESPNPSWGSASEKPVIAVGDVELRFGNEQRTLSTDS